MAFVVAKGEKKINSSSSKKKGVVSRLAKRMMTTAATTTTMTTNPNEKGRLLHTVFEEITQRKVMIVGNEGSGKTSLIQSLREWCHVHHGGQRKGSKSAVPSDGIGCSPSTFGIDVFSMINLFDDQYFRFFDCSGHLNYLPILHVCLSFLLIKSSNHQIIKSSNHQIIKIDTLLFLFV